MRHEMAIHPLGLDHIVLRVADIERTIEFYRDVIGCTLERRLDDIGLIQLRAGAALIDLVPLDSELGFISRIVLPGDIDPAG